MTSFVGTEQRSICIASSWFGFAAQLSFAAYIGLGMGTEVSVPAGTVKQEPVSKSTFFFKGSASADL